MAGVSDTVEAEVGCVGDMGHGVPLVNEVRVLILGI